MHLMRSLLNVHPHIQCDTQLKTFEDITKLERITEGGKVAGSYNSQVRNPCVVSGEILRIGFLVSEQLPNARFIHMIRDGRAVAHDNVQAMTRSEKNAEKINKKYVIHLEKWSNVSSMMFHQCSLLGEKCLKVYFEELIENTPQQLRRIADFVKLPNIRSSRDRFIEEAVLKVAHLKEQNVQRQWIEEMPAAVRAAAEQHAPMLKVLGYQSDGTLVVKDNPYNLEYADNSAKHIGPSGSQTTM
ncbi:unnamed protein product [Nippostrongylus brasiliensis]|uniref:Protein-tyrosine sulfotransferase n=1 Tax=Nippostrongylus brasiliensis TaxID=27835 RepID=A0A0N4YST7_NIPBR|nr:unnamed protein product [Nippostrongylus brasiliensis]